VEARPPFFSGHPSSYWSEKPPSYQTGISHESLSSLGSSPFTVPTSPSIPPPPPPPRKVPRRRYHGPFDACSREDLLPEFWDEENSTVEEAPPLDTETRLAQLRALANWKPEAAPKSAGDTGAWSPQRMARHSIAVRNRLLAAYHTSPAEPEPATALRGLPVVVAATPTYPEKVHSRVVDMLEMKIRWMRGRL
jgi:hypothetical protein